jgi:nucleoside-diphosphate-sugar epimerase
VTKVLITGGCGFIGTHLARSLAERGDEVDLLDNFARGRRDRDLEDLVARPGVRLVECDLLEPAALEGLDRDYGLIFHLAAIVGVANVLEAPYAVLRDNVGLLVPLIEFAARQTGLHRLVFASTSEVYGGALEQGSLPIPTPESVPIVLPDLDRPRTSYMLSKVYGEALCQQSGLPVTVIRPHNVYGPRMGLAHVIPELLQRAHEAEEGGRLEVYSVDHRRTFCHVSDAVEMIVRSAGQPSAVGEALNIGTQRPEVRIGELADLIVRVVGRKLEVEPLPATPGSPLRRCPDMSKTAELTGYVAGVGLEEGVRDTYDWYRQNLFAATA